MDSITPAGILELKEVLALVTLLAILIYVFARHIPYLLNRDAERMEKEAQRHHETVTALKQTMDKLDDTMKDGLNSINTTIKDSIFKLMGNTNGRKGSREE